MVGVVIALASVGSALTRHEATETHMGSPFQITVYTADEATASRVLRLGFARIAELDRALSDYDPESELMRLCARAGGPPVPVGADLATVLERALDVAGRSGGAFDPTIAPVVRLWRRARREKKLPDPEAIARARSLVGHRKVHLDRGARTVRLEPGVRLDLGGIAKGYASEEAVRAVRSAGVPIVLVAGAGDIVAGDPPPGEAGWRVGVAGLDAPGTAPPDATIRLKNAAISTSGDAEQFVILDGKRYSHVVDPRTGLGLTERCSVTVIAPEGATADALDTAASILGPEAGLKLVAGFDRAEVLFVRRRGGETLRDQSPGFRRLMEAGPRPR